MDAPVDGHLGPLQFSTLYTRIILELSQHPTLAQERLARRLDVTMRTAQRHLTQLEAEGYLTVDRSHKPFRYTIDWSRTLPSLPWLRLILFHPAVIPALAQLSSQAAQVYDLACRTQQDPAAALQHLRGAATVPA